MDFTKRKQTWTIGWCVVAAIFGVLLLLQFWNTARQTEAISYSEFEQLVAGKKISEVVIDSDMIEGTLKEPVPDGKNKFVTVRVDPAIADKLAAEGIKVSDAPPTRLITRLIGTILPWTVPAVIFYFLWAFPLRKHGRQARARRPHDGR